MVAAQLSIISRWRRRFAGAAWASFPLTIASAPCKRPEFSAPSPLLAQDKPRVSPHETVKAEIKGSQVSVVYGRPYSKDPKSGEARKVWCTLVPYGKVWRMGADEATLMTTEKPIEMGGTTIPAG